MAHQDNLPEVHVNEGRVMGRFELPPADMQHIRYQGRVVLVLVADANEVTIKDTKDGDTQALWKFTGVDAAIVRDEKMKEHLANVLYLDGLEAPEIGTVSVTYPEKKMVGVYGEEGEFLGFESEDLDDDVQEEEEETDEVEEVVIPERDDVFRVDSNRPIQHRDPMLERFLNQDLTGANNGR